MGPVIPERGWKDMRPPKVRWRVKNAFRQGDSNLSKQCSYQEKYTEKINDKL